MESWEKVSNNGRQLVLQTSNLKVSQKEELCIGFTQKNSMEF